MTELVNNASSGVNFVPQFKTSESRFILAEVQKEFVKAKVKDKPIKTFNYDFEVAQTKKVKDEE